MQSKMSKYEVILLVVLSLIFVVCGCAADKNKEVPMTTPAVGEAQDAKAPAPAATADAVRSVTATVAEIDYKTRRATLKMPDGSTVPITVSEAAYNFDQVKVGDLVDISLTQSIAVMLEKDTGGQAGVMTSSGFERAPKGQKPQGTAYTTMDVRAKVVAIDYKTRTVDLSGPDGKVFPVVVDSSVQNFETVKVGDIVLARYTEAVAISVRPATPPAK
jgi:hypothetical protein